MTEKTLLDVLRGYKAGEVSEAEIIAKLKNFSLATENLGFANIDHGRELRQGFPEVVYSPGKTKEQLKIIFKNLYEHSNGNLIASRASREQFEFLRDEIPAAIYDETAQMIYVDRDKTLQRDENKKILVVTAGTSDVPVAEEARLTAYLWGNAVSTCYDCGVAGIHRLFKHMDEIISANVIIVVAGMEGALASVVGGLTNRPVIAVPTSVGYGASFQGLAALLAMLNTCAAGVGVVNIDNGFGAGVLAAKINSGTRKKEEGTS
ncbi:MAG: nickel pincer cofactor biosynthesis protein LarB [Selenomonadaceae bacterium]|nr:nickel pincer cofactor biosynthesis protein LarB [Selenomonadaceae bacterium]